MIGNTGAFFCYPRRWMLREKTRQPANPNTAIILNHQGPRKHCPGISYLSCSFVRYSRQADMR